jgi:hypothetical protein
LRIRIAAIVVFEVIVLVAWVAVPIEKSECGGVSCDVFGNTMVATIEGGDFSWSRRGNHFEARFSALVPVEFI